MKLNSLEQKYEFLIECVCSEEFAQGAVMMGGYNDETMDAILFYYTGWRNFEGYLEEMLEK